MRRVLSSQTKELIEDLHKKVSFWESSAKHKSKTLSLIASSGDPAAIPHITAFLLESNRAVAGAAAIAVSKLLEILNPDELPWLDESLRERSQYRWAHPVEWTQMTPRDVGRLLLLDQNAVFALGVASFHANGYVRGKALQKLEEIKDGRELPFLLLRLNDWVEPIRKEADRMVRERLTAQYAPYFVLAIHLVRRLSVVRRAEPAEIVNAIERLLTSKEGYPALETGLFAPDRRVRSTCYEILLRAVDVDPKPLLARALSDKEPAIRLLAARRFRLVNDDEFLRTLTERANCDRFAPVRRASMEAVLSRFPAKGPGMLESALLDSHPSIRGYAQFQIARAKDFDLRTIYLQELARGNARNLYAAIIGTGETGKEADADILIPHLQSATPRIRAAAIRAISQLRPLDLSHIFLEYVADSSASVSREARKGLTKILPLLPAEQLWRVFMATSLRHVRRNVLYLIARLSKWESIGYLLEAVVTDDEDTNHIAGLYLRCWHNAFNSSFTVPTQNQKNRLIHALEKARPLLEMPLLNQIEFGLARF